VDSTHRLARPSGPAPDGFGIIGSYVDRSRDGTTSIGDGDSCLGAVTWFAAEPGRRADQKRLWLPAVCGFVFADAGGRCPNRPNVIVLDLGMFSLAAAFAWSVAVSRPSPSRASRRLPAVVLGGRQAGIAARDRARVAGVFAGRLDGASFVRGRRAAVGRATPRRRGGVNSSRSPHRFAGFAVASWARAGNGVFGRATTTSSRFRYDPCRDSS